MKNRFRKGFTLIELMVVVAIIAILMSAGLLAFTNAQRNSRDSRRRADMDALSKAMEQYNNNNNGVYPTTAQGTGVLTTYFPTGAIPVDPKAGQVYTVTLSATGATYCTCALLESTPNRGNSTSNACAYAAAGGNYFCLSQRQ